MFQTFEETSHPSDGPPRLAALRAVCAQEGVSGFLVPRADAHQGEYVADSDARLGWLTGFTGSAGFAVVLPDISGVFIDGRYRMQVRAQVDLEHFTPVHWPETQLHAWLLDHAAAGSVIGFDPWLHTREQIDTLRGALEDSGIALREVKNLVDVIWSDRPAPPAEPAFAYPEEFSGLDHAGKRALVAKALADAGHTAAVLTLPDSICWLLNIRGADLPRVPVMQAFAIVHADGDVDLFANPEKLAGLTSHLGDRVRVHPQGAFVSALSTLNGTVRVDRSSAPLAVSTALAEGDAKTAYDRDPCILPKACKSEAEIAGAHSAHLRDGAAMVEFLCWLDGQARQLVQDPSHVLSEIDVVTALEGYRRATNQLRDISFDTISGSGPNGAIVHYRVSEKTNRRLQPGELFLVDSGGQYIDGTTDITRTVAIGDVSKDICRNFTRVLQGVIAISRVRWPVGLVGRDLDALARFNLWTAGLDFDHGTGHGVGAYLSVHEGPQRLSRTSSEPLQPGMILSNEPGYYREGAYGIRIENLVVVDVAEVPEGGDDRDMLRFETLTYVPIDLRLVCGEMLAPEERRWLNAYHAKTREMLEPLVSPEARDWLLGATRAI